MNIPENVSKKSSHCYNIVLHLTSYTPCTILLHSIKRLLLLQQRNRILLYDSGIGIILRKTLTHGSGVQSSLFHVDARLRERTHTPTKSANRIPFGSAKSTTYLPVDLALLRSRHDMHRQPRGNFYRRGSFSPHAAVHEPRMSRTIPDYEYR